MRPFQRMIIILFALMYVISGCASTRGQGNKVQSNPPIFDSEESEIGAELHQQILSQFHPYTDKKVTDYISGVGSNLTDYVERRDLHYQFTVLYNDKIYATSSPGGYIYVTTGMLYFLQNEAQLAAVIAHEIAEQQYKDPKLNKTRQMLEKITRTGATIGPAFGTIGALSAVGMILMNQMLVSGEMTIDERLHKADREAMNYMVNAGYDPQGLIDLLYRFLQADKKIAPYYFDYMQSRPITMERFDSINQEFQKLPLQDKSFSTNAKHYLEVTKGIREIYKT